LILIVTLFYDVFVFRQTCNIETLTYNKDLPWIQRSGPVVGIGDDLATPMDSKEFYFWFMNPNGGYVSEVAFNTDPQNFINNYYRPILEIPNSTHDYCLTTCRMRPETYQPFVHTLANMTGQRISAELHIDYEGRIRPHGLTTARYIMRSFYPQLDPIGLYYANLQSLQQHILEDASAYYEDIEIDPKDARRLPITKFTLKETGLEVCNNRTVLTRQIGDWIAWYERRKAFENLKALDSLTGCISDDELKAFRARHFAEPKLIGASTRIKCENGYYSNPSVYINMFPLEDYYTELKATYVRLKNVDISSSNGILSQVDPGLFNLSAPIITMVIKGVMNLGYHSDYHCVPTNLDRYAILSPSQYDMNCTPNYFLSRQTGMNVPFKPTPNPTGSPLTSSPTISPTTTNPSNAPTSNPSKVPSTSPTMSPTPDPGPKYTFPSKYELVTNLELYVEYPRFANLLIVFIFLIPIGYTLLPHKLIVRKADINFSLIVVSINLIRVFSLLLYVPGSLLFLNQVLAAKYSYQDTGICVYEGGYRALIRDCLNSFPELECDLDGCYSQPPNFLISYCSGYFREVDHRGFIDLVPGFIRISILCLTLALTTLSLTNINYWVLSVRDIRQTKGHINEDIRITSILHFVLCLTCVLFTSICLANDYYWISFIWFPIAMMALTSDMGFTIPEISHSWLCRKVESICCEIPIICPAPDESVNPEFEIADMDPVPEAIGIDSLMASNAGNAGRDLPEL
jgi:hypothetical protein